MYPSLYPHIGFQGICGTCWVPFGEGISGVQKTSSQFPPVYFRAHLIRSLTAEEEGNIHRGALIMMAPGVHGVGWVVRKRVTGLSDSEYD